MSIILKYITLLITLVFMMHSSTVNAQFENKLALGVAPSAYLHPYYPSVTFSVETMIFENARIDLAYGLDINATTFFNFHTDPSGRHHVFKFAYKESLISKKNLLDEDLYLAGEYFTVLNNYTKLNDQYVISGRVLNFDSARISRSIHGVRLKFGWTKSWGPIGLETYTGIGVRRLTVQYETVNEQVSTTGSNFEEYFFRIDEEPGSRIKPDFNGGFKVFYLINFNLFK